VNLASLRRRRIALLIWWQENRPGTYPCYLHAGAYAHGEIDGLESIPEGVHWSGNGYSEYLICEGCREQRFGGPEPAPAEDPAR
jgi:hypothetical protein